MQCWFRQLPPAGKDKTKNVHWCIARAGDSQNIAGETKCSAGSCVDPLGLCKSPDQLFAGVVHQSGPAYSNHYNYQKLASFPHGSVAVTDQIAILLVIAPCLQCGAVNAGGEKNPHPPLRRACDSVTWGNIDACRHLWLNIQPFLRLLHNILPHQGLYRKLLSYSHIMIARPQPKFKEHFWG